MEPLSILYSVVRGLLLASATHREVMARIDEFAKQHNMSRQEVIALLQAEAKRRGDEMVDRSLAALDQLPSWAWMAALGPLGIIARPAVRFMVRRPSKRPSE